MTWFFFVGGALITAGLLVMGYCIVSRNKGDNLVASIVGATCVILGLAIVALPYVR